MAEIRCNKSRTRFVLATDRGWWYLLRSVVSVDGYDPWPPDSYDRREFSEVLIEIPESAAKETAERFGCGVMPSSLLAWVEARKADAADAPAARFTPSEGSDPRMLEVFGFEPSSPMTPPCPTVGEAFDQIRSIVLMMEGGAAETRALLAAVNAYFAPSRE